MNSFQIIQAKRFLVDQLHQRDTKEIAVEEAMSLLKSAGYQVTADVLRVLVLGSSSQQIAFNSNHTAIMLLESNE